MRIIFYILILACAFSCKKGEMGTELNRGYEYTPTIEGLEREYLVQTIERFGTKKDTATYYLKEVIGKSFPSGDAMLTELLRYKKTKIEDEYVFDSLWGFKVQFNYTVVSEGLNERAELGFPVYNNLIFDENQYNTSAAFNLFQKNGFTKEVAGGSYSNCVSTFRNDLSNLIETISQEHYFAKNVGLIYSSKINVSHQRGDTIGSYYEKELISFKK